MFCKLRAALFVIVGNVTIFGIFAWRGTAQLGAKGLVISALLSLAIFNGVFALRTRELRNVPDQDRIYPGWIYLQDGGK